MKTSLSCMIRWLRPIISYNSKIFVETMIMILRLKLCNAYKYSKKFYRNGYRTAKTERVDEVETWREKYAEVSRMTWKSGPNDQVDYRMNTMNYHMFKYCSKVTHQLNIVVKAGANSSQLEKQFLTNKRVNNQRAGRFGTLELPRCQYNITREITEMNVHIM